MLSCKDATKLVSQKQDAQLSLMQRISLSLHLMMCSGCKNYERQIDVIHKACRRISGSDD
ncbi:hypothetical protein BOV90_01485 [Solemya velum gill symbiont]|uniref:anti-sigma factor family protein n=1 Tax=Solemya velum gill symbiont TaxID=2340 RepID=UPI00099827C4|nr:hypothetical protein [Solemya velum gill symbiont]OOY38411.1 hypothetical protein BOV89_03135 [Solemya velum gill symbiont]OOY41009.1 hypothetical protein BOV90_01485 [Solemya velum gill symbiont]OOY45555.1 hypothetical protein BOV92_04965 [Solemya velum gill symbiont]